MNIDRQRFLRLAMSMGAGATAQGCVIYTQPAQPTTAPAQTTWSAPGNAPATSYPAAGGTTVYGGGYAPAQECTQWDPSGECVQWMQAQAYAPTQECVGWNPTGECIQWMPNQPVGPAVE